MHASRRGPRTHAIILGFLMFALFLTLAIFIPSAIALGGANYLAPLVSGANPNLVGALLMSVIRTGCTFVHIW